MVNILGGETQCTCLELSPIMILLPLDSGVISKLGNLVDTRGLIMDLPVHDRGVIEEAKRIRP